MEFDKLIVKRVLIQLGIKPLFNIDGNDIVINLIGDNIIIHNSDESITIPLDWYKDYERYTNLSGRDNIINIVDEKYDRLTNNKKNFNQNP